MLIRVGIQVRVLTVSQARASTFNWSIMNKKEEYTELLKSKIEIAPELGIDAKVSLIKFKDGQELKPHQRDGINWAIKGGRRALFESFGLGKTIQQLLICQTIMKHVPGKALIVIPLGVRREFRKDATDKLGIDLYYVTTQAEADALPDGSICLTNYERVRDGDIDPTKFVCCCLDEASVLRSDGSKTHHTFIKKFKGVRFKFVATATPSPNEFIELIFYAAFLEIMDKGQCKTRFFKRDSTKADKLTLHAGKEKEFMFWLITWALFITKPSDLGYSDEGYDLPKLNIIYHELKVDHSTALADRDGQTTMYREAAMGLKPAAKEKKDTLMDRVGKMREILLNDTDSHYIIWHDLEPERHEINKVLRELTGQTGFDVYGSLDLDTREQRSADFADGKMKYLSTKPQISGSGSNFQRHCHKAIFLGIGYKFNDFIQAIHRILRFLQMYDVEVHIIYAESEREILRVLLAKWEKYDKLITETTSIIREYGLSSGTIEEKLMRTFGCERKIVEGKNFKWVQNDCTLETMDMPDNSVHLIHTSLPFSIQYEYTPSYNDFGHNINNEAFFRQMDFLIPELYRVLAPGRIAAIHVKDRVIFGNFSGKGFSTVYRFSDKTNDAFEKHGFEFCGRITIATDVVRENKQTYRLGWSEVVKDGTKMSVGLSEYVLLFRKVPTDTSNAYADVPVVKTKSEYSRARWQIDAHGFWRSSGNRFLSPEEIKSMDYDKLQHFFKLYSLNTLYDYERHVQIAEELEAAKKLPSGWMLVAPESPDPDIWTDVTRIKTLNTSQSMGRKTMHLCPLQFDVVDRIINRYTNKGEWVYDPFGGISTVPYRAIKLGRNGIGCELNPEYYRDGLSYLRAGEIDMNTPTLFDLIEFEKEVAS